MFLSKLNPYLIFNRISLRFRLTFLFVVIFGVTIAFSALFNYTVMLDSLQKDFDDALFNYSIDISNSIQVGAKGDLLFPSLEIDQGKVLPFPLGTALIRVVHVSGQVLARYGDFGNFTPPYEEGFTALNQGKEAHFTTLKNLKSLPDPEAESYRLISFPIDPSPQPKFMLQIAAPMILLENQFQNRLRVIQYGVPLIIIFAALAGLFVASRALAPIRVITDTAQSISAQDLSKRLPIPKTHDEVRSLVETLNQMLERLDFAFKSQERFVADASHQLLTPLTVLKGEMEVFKKLQGQDLSPATQQFITSSLQEVDKLSRMVKDLLFLASIDDPNKKIEFQKISLDEVLISAITRVNSLAQKKNIQLQFNIPNPERKYVFGNADLLENLFFNLIENAVKYSNENSVILINLIWTETHTLVEIKDHGIGVDPDQIDLIFNRFSRSPESTIKAKGFGLGLAIAQNIAKIHFSQIQVLQNHPNGSIFKLEIKNF